MAQEDSQEAHLEHFLAVGAKWLQKALRRAFPGLSPEMIPEDSQKAHLGHFLALGAKWPQKALRRHRLNVKNMQTRD